MRAVIHKFDHKRKQRVWSYIQDQHFVIAGRLIIVPAGYWFNGASIPRPLWSIYSPVGQVFEEASVHDWLYDTQGQGIPEVQKINYTRAQTDIIFREHMRQNKVLEITREVFYHTVKTFGAGHWKRKSFPDYLLHKAQQTA